MVLGNLGKRLILTRFANIAKTFRHFSTTPSNNKKVTLVGAAGGIGQPCLMLLKMNSLVSCLCAVDVQKMTPGVAKDVSHMNFPANVTGYMSPDQLKESLAESDIVLITAGVPRKPDMTRDDLFKVNANIVKTTAEAVADCAPEALVVIVTNPVNSAVPIFCKTMDIKGKLNPNKIFGCSTLDCVRSSTFVGELKGLDPREVCVPCIGGHSAETIIPVLSQMKPKLKTPLTDKEIQDLTKRIQNAGTEVVKAKAGGGSATLSMAFAAARFVNSLLRALNNEQNVVECSYVKADICQLTYFATPLVLGPCGIDKNLGIPEMSDFEKSLLEPCIKSLKGNIEKGEKFACSS